MFLQESQFNILNLLNSSNFQAPKRRKNLSKWPQSV